MTDSNEIKAKAWNACITPRLEALLVWFEHDQWAKGLAPYLKQQHDLLQQQLNSGCKDPREEDRLRGRLLELEDFLDLPKVIERHIELANAKQNRPKPSGTAGY